ncbi:hypothetical protein HO151_04820, partial [Streptomyces sp. 8P21H-1]|nr:hypothetical protein [Streptomyces sp. 8P21H-1]
LGRHSEALRSYQWAMATRPLPRYALELGELYESLGMSGAARAQYDVVRARVREGRAGGVNEELLLGLFEADHGGAEGARDAVRRLRAEWARHPSAAVADALGWALHRAGEDEEALVLARRATDRRRGGAARVALYSFHRGMAERETGALGAARRHLEEALRIDPAFSPVLAPVASKVVRELDACDLGAGREVGRGRAGTSGPPPSGCTAPAEAEAEAGG